KQMLAHNLVLRALGQPIIVVSGPEHYRLLARSCAPRASKFLRLSCANCGTMPVRQCPSGMDHSRAGDVRPESAITPRADEFAKSDWGQLQTIRITSRGGRRRAQNLPAYKSTWPGPWSISRG